MSWPQLVWVFMLFYFLAPTLAPFTIMIYDCIYVSLEMHAKTACVVQVAWGALYSNYFSASVRCSLSFSTHFSLIVCPLQSGINTAGQGGDMLLSVSGCATPSVLSWLVLWKGWSSVWIPHTFLVMLHIPMLSLGCSMKHSNTKAFQNPKLMQVHSLIYMICF